MRFLAFIGALAILAAIAAAIFLFGGFYDAAATDRATGGRRLGAGQCA